MSADLDGFTEVMRAIAAGPRQGAAALDRLIARLAEVRDRLLARAALAEGLEGGWLATGGTGDRAALKVVGPDGGVRQEARTAGWEPKDVTKPRAERTEEPLL